MAALYALKAGLFASLASLSGRLSLNSEDAKLLCMKVYCSMQNTPNDDCYLDKESEATGDNTSICHMISPLLRLGFLGFIFLCNSMMWINFAKALNSSQTTGEAMALNAATNFIFTGLASALLFGEVLTVKWFLGMGLIVAGLYCIHKANKSPAILKKEA